MHRTHHRFLSMLAAGTVALSLGAAPALAGSDGCAGGDCQDEDTPATVVPGTPAPVTPAPATPAPLQSSTSNGGGDTAPKTASKKRSNRTTHRTVATRTRNVTVAQRTVPQGAVAAGYGGTAPHDSDGVLFGVAGVALVLAAAGGRLVAARRTGS